MQYIESNSLVNAHRNIINKSKVLTDLYIQQVQLIQINIHTNEQANNNAKRFSSMEVEPGMRTILTKLFEVNKIDHSARRNTISVFALDHMSSILNNHMRKTNGNISAFQSNRKCIYYCFWGTSIFKLIKLLQLINKILW